MPVSVHMSCETSGAATDRVHPRSADQMAVAQGERAGDERDRATTATLVAPNAASARLALAAFA